MELIKGKRMAFPENNYTLHVEDFCEADTPGFLTDLPMTPLEFQKIFYFYIHPPGIFHLQQGAANFS